MGNHVLGEVFEYEIFDMKDNLLFEIKSTKSNTIYNNTLIIEDAVVNTQFFSDMMYGKYGNKNVKVLGRTIVRNIDDGRDNGILYMTINIATIETYKVVGEAGGSYFSRMVIKFADRDRKLDKNFNLDLRILEDGKNAYEKDDNGDFIFFE